MYRGEYQLIGSELSFFTRKLEAQLRFQRIFNVVIPHCRFIHYEYWNRIKIQFTIKLTAIE